MIYIHKVYICSFILFCLSPQHFVGPLEGGRYQVEMLALNPQAVAAQTSEKVRAVSFISHIFCFVVASILLFSFGVSAFSSLFCYVLSPPLLPPCLGFHFISGASLCVCLLNSVCLSVCSYMSAFVCLWFCLSTLPVCFFSLRSVRVLAAIMFVCCPPFAFNWSGAHTVARRNLRHFTSYLLQQGVSLSRLSACLQTCAPLAIDMRLESNKEVVAAAAAAAQKHQWN